MLSQRLGGYANKNIIIKPMQFNIIILNQIGLIMKAVVLGSFHKPQFLQIPAHFLLI
jgi:hypothetical protein